MKEMFWGIVTLFLWLVAIGCMANDHWTAGFITFGLGIVTVHGCQTRSGSSITIIGRR